MKVILINLCFIFFLISCGSNDSSSTVVEPPLPEKITWSGAGDLGIFDPSLSRDPDSNRLWMSYSSVNISSYYLATEYWRVSIRLAYSDDNGDSWQDAGLVVSPDAEETVGFLAENHPTGEIPLGSQGIWQSETSSLVYDPAAPLAERWKLIWHQYLNANLTSFFADYSWIAMKMAATPADLATATPVKLFGGVALQPDNTQTGSPAFAPIGGAPAIQLNSDLTQEAGEANISELDFCVFAEPSLHAANHSLYLIIYCADASTIPVNGSITEYLVSFRCNNLCDITNAASWQYLGRLLSPADAQAATGDHHFQAPSIIEKNAKTYLLVTPVNVTSGERYNGCRVYEFSDIDVNQLLRDNGALVEVARIDGDAGLHNGACGGVSGQDGGILLSQFGTAGTADTFQIYKTQVSLP